MRKVRTLRNMAEKRRLDVQALGQFDRLGMALRTFACQVIAMVLVATVAGTAQAQIGQETLGRLFFSFEERNVLEAVRQGVVDTGAIPSIGSDIYIPEVGVPEISFTPQQVIQKDGNRITRGKGLRYNGLIRIHRPDGSVGGRVIIDGRDLDAEQQAAYSEQSGLRFRTDLDDGAVTTAEDKIFKTNVELTRGSSIKADGEVSRNTSGKKFIVLKRSN